MQATPPAPELARRIRGRPHHHLLARRRQERSMTTSVTSVPERLRTDFDIYDPALSVPTDTVNEKVRALAETSPVVWSDRYGGHWVVTRYEEIHEVLRHPETYSSFPNNLVPHGAGKFLPLEIDPPDHTAFRKA